MFDIDCLKIKLFAVNSLHVIHYLGKDEHNGYCDELRNAHDI